jgi:7-cyano-7-deazaguanine synthase
LTPSKRDRAVALVSGGLDSVVSLAQAAETMEIRLVLFFNYGQRAVERERDAVLGVVNYYQFPLRELDIRWLGTISPEGMRAGASTGTRKQPPLQTLDDVWIPNRNGIFINAGAAFAESHRCSCVVTGFNREEAEEFPDNSGDFIERANAALALSTRSGVRVRSFTQDLDKRDILQLGARLRAPLSVIWSCYHAGERMCGECASCRRLKGAIAALPASDRPPLEFEA